MRSVIDHCADVDAVDRNERTPLHRAALYNKAGAIDVLVEAGANIEARDRNGFTPLHGAAGERSLEALLALLKHGAHVNTQDLMDQTPLHWVARWTGKYLAVEVVDLLLKSGADETILDEFGEVATDVVGRNVDEQDPWADVDEEHHLAEDVHHVLGLLENAPADRVWRRRGYPVLCRAYPVRMHQLQEKGSVPAGMARRTRGRAEVTTTEAGSCSAAVDASPVDERGGGDWAVVVAKVVGLQEEGIFRTIVGYL